LAWALRGSTLEWNHDLLIAILLGILLTRKVVSQFVVKVVIIFSNLFLKNAVIYYRYFQKIIFVKNLGLE